MTDSSMELIISALQTINGYRKKVSATATKVELNDFLVLLNAGIFASGYLPTRPLLAKAANWTMYFYLKRNMSLKEAVNAGSQSVSNLAVTAI